MWKQILDVVKDVGTIVGVLVTLFGVLTGIFKPFRQRLVAWIRKVVNADEQEQKHSDDFKLIQSQIAELKATIGDWTKSQSEHNDKVDRKLDALSAQYEQIQHGSYYTLGNVIREVYHDNKEHRRLSEHDYDLCKKVYSLYHDEWHQNGPIEAMWSEMQDWEIIYN